MAERRDDMKRLYKLQVEGTRDLYDSVDYFFRMTFWETIAQISHKVISAKESKDLKDIYYYLIKLMDAFITNSENAVSIENINVMISCRNRIKKRFGTHPERFVEELKLCLLLEDEILKRDKSSSNQGCIDVDVSLSDLMIRDVNTSNDFIHLTTSFSQSEENLGTESIQDLHHQSPAFNPDLLGQMDQTFQELESLVKNLQQGNQNNELRMRQKEKLLDMMTASLPFLRKVKDEYLRHQALMENRLRPRENIDFIITRIFDRFGRIVKTLWKDLRLICKKLENILNSFLEMSLLILEHPNVYALVNNQNKGGSLKNADPSGPNSSVQAKDKPTFDTKEQSFVSAKIQILGHDSLPGIFMKETKIELVTEDNAKCGQLEIQSKDSDRQGVIIFSKMKISGYRRNGTGKVNHQCVRLDFGCQVEVFDQEFTMKAKSLPFYLITGSVQKLELIGTRMWYCCCNDGYMYSDCKFYEELPADQVLQMLDDRVRSIQHKEKRPLSNGAKAFLLKMIPIKQGFQGGEQKISLQSFVKEKNLKTIEKKSITFFTWFYAVVNTIEACLVEDWINGKIYDFMSHEEAKQILLDDQIPPKTALVRPTRSSVTKLNCSEAEVGFAVEIKCRLGDEDIVQVITCEKSQIVKRGLYNILKNIETQDGTPLVTHILTPKRRLPLAMMEGKSSGQMSVQEYHDTKAELETKLKLKIDKTIYGYTPPTKSVKVDPQEEEFVPRKRKSNRYSVASPSIASSLNSPAETADQSSQSAITSPASVPSPCSTMAAPDSNWHREMDFQEQGFSRGGNRQVMDPVTGNTFAVFGGIEVDVSKIKKNFSTDRGSRTPSPISEIIPTFCRDENGMLPILDQDGNRIVPTLDNEGNLPKTVMNLNLDENMTNFSNVANPDSSIEGNVSVSTHNTDGNVTVPNFSREENGAISLSEEENLNAILNTESFPNLSSYDANQLFDFLQA